MVGKEILKELAEYAISASKADQTEVILASDDSNTTRYANNKIHQNISQNTVSVLVRSIILGEKGGKIGIASGNVSTKEGMAKVVKNSNEIAKNQKADPHFVSLNEKKDLKEADSFDQAAADLTVKDKALMVKEILDLAKKEKVNASGIFETVIGEVAIANSKGVFGYHPFSSVTFTSIIHTKTSSGFASKLNWKLERVDIKKIAKMAIQKAKQSQNPIQIEPGRYDVILEEEAVGDLLGYLAYMALGGKHFQEGQSFVAGNLGEKLLSEKVTIWDDPFHPEGMPTPFDLEGHPKTAIPLVERGVVKNVVYDTYFGKKYDQKSTGHYVGSLGLGPIPLNMILMPGKSSVPKMIKNTKKGILVTRFHYTNVHHYKKLNMTGMTKDGTFLIEDGKIKAPIKNLRFTQSVVDALLNIEEIGKDLKLVDSIGTHLVPALKIKDFSFTSVTEH